jgi:hypothetical protein
MKKRISILIEEKVIRQAKRLAVEEGRPLSAVIQDALISYLRKKAPDLRKREEAYQFFCERPMRLRKEQLRKILKVDAYE